MAAEIEKVAPFSTQESTFNMNREIDKLFYDIGQELKPILKGFIDDRKYLVVAKSQKELPIPSVSLSLPTRWMYSVLSWSFQDRVNDAYTRWFKAPEETRTPQPPEQLTKAKTGTVIMQVEITDLGLSTISYEYDSVTDTIVYKPLKYASLVSGSVLESYMLALGQIQSDKFNNVVVEKVAT